MKLINRFAKEFYCYTSSGEMTAFYLRLRRVSCLLMMLNWLQRKMMTGILVLLQFEKM